MSTFHSQDSDSDSARHLLVFRPESLLVLGDVRRGRLHPQWDAVVRAATQNESVELALYSNLRDRDYAALIDRLCVALQIKVDYRVMALRGSGNKSATVPKSPSPTSIPPRAALSFGELRARLGVADKDRVTYVTSGACPVGAGAFDQCVLPSPWITAARPPRLDRAIELF